MAKKWTLLHALCVNQNLSGMLYELEMIDYPIPELICYLVFSNSSGPKHKANESDIHNCSPEVLNPD